MLYEKEAFWFLQSYWPRGAQSNALPYPIGDTEGTHTTVCSPLLLDRCDDPPQEARGRVQDLLDTARPLLVLVLDLAVALFIELVTFHQLRQTASFSSFNRLSDQGATQATQAHTTTNAQKLKLLRARRLILLATCLQLRRFRCFF